MTSQAPQCDAREEETLLATNDTAAASISVDGGRQQSSVLAGMKWLDRAMSARLSTIRPLADRDLDGLPLDSRIHDAFKIRSAETKLLELFAAGELNGTVHTCVPGIIPDRSRPIFVCRRLCRVQSSRTRALSERDRRF